MSKLETWMAIATVAINESIITNLEDYGAALRRHSYSDEQVDAAMNKYSAELSAWKDEKLRELEAEISELLARKPNRLH